MSGSRFININYPFKDSDKGFFLDMNSDDNSAIKADLMHLILTRKGERLYNPDFGTDLLKFIFEPQDGLTMSGIKTEITNAVKKYLPNLKLDNISIVDSTEDDHAAVLSINYTITDDVFTTTDSITIKI